MKGSNFTVWRLQVLGCRFWFFGPGFAGGLVFKAHRLVYHSTLGSRVIKKKKKVYPSQVRARMAVEPLGVVEAWFGG